MVSRVDFGKKCSRKPTVQLFEITDESNQRVPAAGRPHGSALFRTVGPFSLTRFDVRGPLSRVPMTADFEGAHSRFLRVGSLSTFDYYLSTRESRRSLICFSKFSKVDETSLTI